jgi:O-antigen/teichoic acid export membrane protein
MRDILKAAIKTMSGSAGFLFFGMLTIKIMAVVLGPNGVGLYSLLRQTSEFSKNLGTLGGETALVQGLASRKGKVRDEYLLTAFWVFVLGTLLTVATLMILAPWIALWVFHRNDEQTINLVRWLALPVVLLVASSFLNGVINGFRAIGLLALIQALGAGAGALVAYPVSLLAQVGYPVAFIAMMSVTPAVGVALGAWRALREGWLTVLRRGPRMGVDPDSLRHFVSLAGALLVTGLVATGTLLVVRSLVARYAGLTGAGVFAAAWTLSLTYVQIILASFGTYYLPTLSQIGDPTDRVVLMQQVARFATLLSVPVVVGVVVLKPLVVTVLYSGEFAPALEIIRWMLIGDYFKVSGYVVAMPALAYADVKVFFWTELLSHLSLAVFAALALSYFGSVQGIGVGFLLVYVALCAYYWHYSRSRHRLRLTKEMTLPWVLGLALIVGASWYTWTDTRVAWFAAALWICVATAFSCVSLTRNEREAMLRVTLLRWRGGARL